MTAGQLVALGDLPLLRDVDADELVHARRQVVAGGARERLHVDHLAAFAVRDLERRVAHLLRLLLEDRADELLLRGQLGLALGRDLADEEVASGDLGADADDAALVEVLERLLGAVRDVARDLLVAELRRPRVDLVLVDVDRGQHVLLHEPLGDDDRVLEVVALPWHEGHEEVLAERELAFAGGRAVREDVVRLHPVAELHDRALVDERALVRPHELHEVVRVAVPLARRDDDALGVDVRHRAGAARKNHVARVDGSAVLEAGADERRLRDEQRHRLALHVRAHERTVRVVVLEEWDERRRHGDDLRRIDVHVVDGLRVGHDRLALAGAAEHLRVLELPGLEVERLGGLGDRVLALLRGVEVDDLVRHLAAHDLAVRRLHEAELGDRGVRRQRADEADVRAFRCLDRAHAAVMRWVNVAHLDRRALTSQATRAESRQTAPVREPRKRVRLVHEL